MTEPRSLTRPLARHLNFRVKRLDHRRERLQAQLSRVHDARLWTAAIFFVGLIVSAIWREQGFAIPVLGLGSAVFAWLLRKNAQLSRHAREVIALHDFDARQLARLRGEPPPGIDGPASEGLDLNLTGAHSLFTLLDETFSIAGKERLLAWITRAPSVQSAEALRLRQNQIRDLATQTKFLQRLRLKAAANSELRIATGECDRQLTEFATIPVPFWHVALTCALWVVWLCVLIPFLFGQKEFAGWSSALLLLFAGVHAWARPTLPSKNRSAMNSIFKAGEGLSSHLDALVPLFSHIEEAVIGAHAEKLSQLIRQHRPSKHAKSLNRWLALLSVEGNPVVFILFMIFTPWQVIANHGFLRKAQQLRAVFKPCLEELTELEALSSLVFLYAYQTRTFPDITSGSLSMTELYHPLLNRERAVANSFSFHGSERLGLITGSNMAGKSTFLRAVGVNQTLAMMGAPVFAQSFSTGFYRLETCIQVTDSLRDGFSYFFAEVRRLSELIERTRNGPPVLYLIDEIFRGTNNRERRIGSRAVIEALAKTDSCGFISTHDLELTGLAQMSDLLGRIRNVHFKDDLEAGRMTFHYKIHEGPCPSTNALTIMAQAGLGPFADN